MRRRFMLAQLPLLAAAGLAAPTVLRAQARPMLRIGLGPQQPTPGDTRRVWEPVYRLIAERAGADFTLTVTSDWAGIATALANRQIDVAQMGPWGYVLAHINGEAQIINTMLVNGQPSYRAIIVARPGLNLARFPEDARGMSMQMLDRGSTSGWLVPTHFLKSKGIEPQGFFGRYAEGASAAAVQVATSTGQVDLGTGWDTHRNIMIRNGQLAADANRVVWESDPLPNECVVVRAGFDEALGKRLQAAFTSFSNNETEAKLLPFPYTGFIDGAHEPYRVLEQMGRDLGVIRARS
jgi:phosphonate transport system substrate-binding protein